jgi:hypothetical protein
MLRNKTERGCNKSDMVPPARRHGGPVQGGIAMTRSLPTTRLLTTAFLAAAFAASPALAQSAQTNFASFTSLPGGTIVWENGLGYGGGPADGAFYTVPTPGPQTPSLVAAVPVSFTWAAAGLNNAPAVFLLRAFATNTPAVLGGPPTFTANQPGIAGDFYIQGPGNQNWLNGFFANGTIITNIGATSSFFLVNTSPGGLLLNSGTFPGLLPAGAFLTITKTGIPAPGIQAVPGQTLSTFDPAFSGAFGTVPEPASWAMLIAGFGLVGAVLRRRRVTVSV